MFQKLQGALDRIADEQARQRAGQARPSPSSQPSRRPLQNASASNRRPLRQAAGSESSEKGQYPTGPDPEPSSFENDASVDEGNQVQVDTEDKKEDTATEDVKEGNVDNNGGGVAVEAHQRADGGMSARHAVAAPAAETHISPEVEAKLKKLNKLDAKYQELLQAYRRAHKRNSAIEPFEARLRETTPLTSIGDPDAFVEYLSQLKAKEDLVVQELKRVTTEREGLARKFENSEREAKTMKDELEQLREAQDQTVNSAQDGEEFYSIDSEVPRLQSELEDRDSQIEKLGLQIQQTTTDLEASRSSTAQMMKDLETSKREFEETMGSKAQLEFTFAEEKRKLEEKNAELTSSLENAQSEQERLRKELQKLQVVASADDEASVTLSSTVGDQASTKKKKHKKKKKKTAGSTTNDAAVGGTAIPEPDDTGTVSDADVQLEDMKKLLEDKDTMIEALKEKVKLQDELKEEIEGLRDELITVGQEHVDTKESLRLLETERNELQKELAQKETELATSTQATDGPPDPSSEKVASDYEDLKVKSRGLESELSIAQELATSRYKEMVNLRDLVQKAQPELVSLRTELNEMRASRESLAARMQEIHKLEARAESLTADSENLRRELNSKDVEIRSSRQQLNRETSQRSAAEEQRRGLQRELQRAQQNAEQSTEEKEKALMDLNDTKASLDESRMKIRDVENRLERLNRETEGLRDEISLKTAQHASAESLMSNVRDQAGEMAAQLKESKERCESLEEELADLHRLIGERGREGETMRRLLSDVEGRAEARVKEMRERLDNAVAERDRAEGEASALQRRRAREVEDLKGRLRGLEQELRNVNDDKADFENSQRELRRQKDADQRRIEQSTKEIADVRAAMSDLKDALDDGERQARESEAERENLTRSLEEAQQRVEKLQKSNKTIADELRSLRATRMRPTESGAQSSRSSFESSQARVTSPTLARPQSPRSISGMSRQSNGTPATDYVYLKNVLLQFMEQKDKNHQMQLIPVLSMLLHFDKKDEQKWTAAISQR